MNKTLYKYSVIVVMLALVMGVSVYADDPKCEEQNYGGETCIVNKRFKIEKEVRLEGDSDWDDEVTIDLNDDDEVDKYIEFRITIENLTDEVEDLDFDEMKMKDSLPDELYRIGGEGLTEYWDNFEPGEEKKFNIKVRIDADELDRDGEFEKCVVNKAEVFWDDEFEGADTATVCWENINVKELPKTGASTAGLGYASISIMVGLYLRYVKKLAF